MGGKSVPNESGQSGTAKPDPVLVTIPPTKIKKRVATQVTFERRRNHTFVCGGNEEIIWERVQDVFDLPNDPQVKANNYIVDYVHPIAGPTKWLQTPLGYSKTPLSTRKMAPVHGENTEEILIETLGYTWDDIATMQSEGVIL